MGATVCCTSAGSMWSMGAEAGARMLSLALVVAVLSCVPGAADSGVGGISFRNTADRAMMLYWVSHDGSYKFQGQLCGNGCQTGFQTYSGHKFIWAEMGPGGREPYPEEIVPVVGKPSLRVRWFMLSATTPQT